MNAINQIYKIYYLIVHTLNVKETIIVLKNIKYSYIELISF